MSLESSEVDALVVGGGFFGGTLAAHLSSERGMRVLVAEMGPELLGRASYANQARVHQGYHYPRSLLTALRCRVNYPRFISDYARAIVGDFEKPAARRTTIDDRVEGVRPWTSSDATKGRSITHAGTPVETTDNTGSATGASP